jgi:hypothetical protein
MKYLTPGMDATAAGNILFDSGLHGYMSAKPGETVKAEVDMIGTA